MGSASAEAVEQMCSALAQAGAAATKARDRAVSRITSAEEVQCSLLEEPPPTSATVAARVALKA